jgi:hypothetical protein
MQLVGLGSERNHPAVGVFRVVPRTRPPVFKIGLFS